jgi:hypothetical protein
VSAWVWLYAWHGEITATVMDLSIFVAVFSTKKLEIQAYNTFELEAQPTNIPTIKLY